MSKRQLEMLRALAAAGGDVDINGARELYRGIVGKGHSSRPCYDVLDRLASLGFVNHHAKAGRYSITDAGRARLIPRRERATARLTGAL